MSWALILAVLASLLVIPVDATPSITAQASTFLSNVVSLDLSKYTITSRKILNDSFLGPDIKEQSMPYTLVYGESSVSAAFNFVNGMFSYCDLSYRSRPAYTQTPPIDVLSQSKILIKRYEAFVSQNGGDTTYLSTMANMLDGISQLQSTSVTSGNMKLNITLYSTHIPETPLETIRWFYTENGLDATPKAVTFDFTNGTLHSISDTWNLYTIGNVNTISQDEALNIAWNTIQNFTLKFVANNGSIFEVKPDLSRVTTDVSFSMSVRNYTVLFPSWDIQYWFDKPINEDNGIHVGIWGDTKQVFLCQSIFIMGWNWPSPTPTKATTSLSSPPTYISKAAPDLTAKTILIAGSAAGMIAAFVAIGITVNKRRNKPTVL